MDKEEFRRRRAAIKAKSDILWGDIEEHRTEEKRVIDVLHNAESILEKLDMTFEERTSLSNSSWANYGYLVALEINPDRMEELERLSTMFGIGVIQLSPETTKTKVIFPSTKRRLDFRSIDKLSEINTEFEQFIKDVEGIITEKDDNKYQKLLNDFIANTCDEVMTDEQLRKYTSDKNISA